jgi:outer membrane protein OmpA-like peptidoglycan-associated protein
MFLITNRVVILVLVWLGGWCLSSAVHAEAKGAVPAELSRGAPAGQKLLVLVRTDLHPDQVNVRYAGRLHASLGPGEYSLVPVCLDASLLELTRTAPVPGAMVGESVIVDVSSGAADAMALHVQAPEGRPLLIKPVALEEVSWESVMRHTRVQSRLQLRCADAKAQVDSASPVAPRVVPAPVVPTQPEVSAPSLVLAADHLFAFGSAQLNHEAADRHIRAPLERAMRQAGIRKITSVLVHGHSDPIGSPDGKKEISKRRAQADAAYLVGVIGVLTRNVHIEWHSDAQLLVPFCPQSPVTARNQCNAPNRRVELFVSGTA